MPIVPGRAAASWRPRCRSSRAAAASPLHRAGAPAPSWRATPEARRARPAARCRRRPAAASPRRRSIGHRCVKEEGVRHRAAPWCRAARGPDPIGRRRRRAGTAPCAARSPAARTAPRPWQRPVRRRARLCPVRQPLQATTRRPARNARLGSERAPPSINGSSCLAAPRSRPQRRSLPSGRREGSNRPGRRAGGCGCSPRPAAPTPFRSWRRPSPWWRGRRRTRPPSAACTPPPPWRSSA